MTMPIITGPRLIAKSEIALNVPIAGPGDPPRSRTWAIKAGIRKADPIAKITATRMNIGKVLEKARSTIEMI